MSYQLWVIEIPSPAHSAAFATRSGELTEFALSVIFISSRHELSPRNA